ncbi:MAG: RHS repeat-associated core domain-containing protein, partial [Clostridia bacterium]|nr:RHS repeat-associated core domain-containing protein [Clostridia bacterium]
AWGKPTGKTGTMAGTLGTLQPFRYRGYVWDEETHLYYLRSRYYLYWKNRFMNSDSTRYSINLYCYCKNKPIRKVDYDGNTGIDIFAPIALIHRLKRNVDDMIDNQEFIAAIYQMIQDRWKYDRKNDKQGMRYGYVDCVSVYRYIIKWYYWGYQKYVPNGVDCVNDIVSNCVYGLEPIDQNGSNLQIGMALFIKDDDGNYSHMGYYAGGEIVYESNYISGSVDGVRAIPLAGSNFSECAYLVGINYDFIIWDEWLQ